MKPTEEADVAVPEYRSYTKRWLVLLVLVLLNMSGAMVWLTFVTVAYRAASFYNTTLATINFLSLVFMMSAIVVGAVATWVLEKFGLKPALLLSAWLMCVGACVRIASAVDDLSAGGKLAVLFVGQIIVALGQPFSMYAPAKTAAIWFPENQRALANTCGSVANPIGVVIAGIVSPLFVNATTGELDVFNLLITMACPAALAAILASFVMTSGKPQTPPSAGSTKKEEYFGSGLTEALKNKNFMILVLTVGGAIGLYSTFATLLEQLLCPFGYTDTLAGICAAVQTACGVVGAAIIGILCDYTKQFSTVVKSCYVITAIGLCVFCGIFHIYIGELILILIAVIGLFSFGIYPIGVELGAEATYPVGVATSSGLILISGQIQSIILVLVLQVIGRPMSPQEVLDNNSQCHPPEGGTDSTTTAYSTTSSFMNATSTGNTPVNPLQTYDMSASVYVCGGYMSLLAIILIAFFRPKYNRMAVEQSRNSEDEKRSKVSDYESSFDNSGYDGLSLELNEKDTSTIL